jgi:hypothetical protein
MPKEIPIKWMREWVKKKNLCTFMALLPIFSTSESFLRKKERKTYYLMKTTTAEDNDYHRSCARWEWEMVRTWWCIGIHVIRKYIFCCHLLVILTLFSIIFRRTLSHLEKSARQACALFVVRLFLLSAFFFSSVSIFANTLCGWCEPRKAE